MSSRKLGFWHRICLTGQPRLDAREPLPQFAAGFDSADAVFAADSGSEQLREIDYLRERCVGQFLRHEHRIIAVDHNPLRSACEIGAGVNQRLKMALAGAGDDRQPIPVGIEKTGLFHRFHKILAGPVIDQKVPAALPAEKPVVPCDHQDIRPVCLQYRSDPLRLLRFGDMQPDDWNTKIAVQGQALIKVVLLSIYVQYFARHRDILGSRHFQPVMLPRSRLGPLQHDLGYDGFQPRGAAGFYAVIKDDQIIKGAVRSQADIDTDQLSHRRIGAEDAPYVKHNVLAV